MKTITTLVNGDHQLDNDGDEYIEDDDELVDVNDEDIDHLGPSGAERSGHSSVWI